MPLEIKELLIKGVIDNSASQQNGNAGMTTEEQQQAIITAAVEKVLQILEDKKQR